MHSKSHLLDVRGFSDAKVDKLLDACRKALSNPSERGGFVTAATFREMRKDIVKITTGSKAVDRSSRRGNSDEVNHGNSRRVLW